MWFVLQSQRPGPGYYKDLASHIGTVVQGRYRVKANLCFSDTLSGAQNEIIDDGYEVLAVGILCKQNDLSLAVRGI